MINLLSNEEKIQIKFSKYNSIILGYVIFAALTAIVLSLLVFGAGLYSQQIANTLTSEKEEILQDKKEFNSSISEARLIGEDLKLIKSLYETDPEYTSQIVAIGRTLDPETRLLSLDLIPYQQGVLDLQIEAKNRTALFRLQKRIIQSELFDFADITSIGKVEGGNYSARFAVRYASNVQASKPMEAKQ